MAKTHKGSKSKQQSQSAGKASSHSKAGHGAGQGKKGQNAKGKSKAPSAASQSSSGKKRKVNDGAVDEDHSSKAAKKKIRPSKRPHVPLPLSLQNSDDDEGGSDVQLPSDDELDQISDSDMHFLTKLDKQGMSRYAIFP